MSTQKTRLTVVQRATAQPSAVTGSDLLQLYLAAPGKQREELFVSTARAAEIAGVSQRTIQFWIDSGSLSAIRIGRNYRVSLDSLRDVLQEGIDN